MTNNQPRSRIRNIWLYFLLAHAVTWLPWLIVRVSFYSHPYPYYPFSLFFEAIAIAVAVSVPFRLPWYIGDVKRFRQMLYTVLVVGVVLNVLGALRLDHYSLLDLVRVSDYYRNLHLGLTIIFGAILYWFVRRPANIQLEALEAAAQRQSRQEHEPITATMRRLWWAANGVTWMVPVVGFILWLLYDPGAFDEWDFKADWLAIFFIIAGLLCSIVVYLPFFISRKRRSLAGGRYSLLGWAIIGTAANLYFAHDAEYGVILDVVLVAGLAYAVYAWIRSTKVQPVQPDGSTRV